ncbi:DNA recombination protein RmuC [Aurantiacibacter spongiae]|nr:DNA recombination protein RmuC [Aurantiacibacter spongiae]
MDLPVLFVVIGVAVVAGLAGYWLGGRPAADWRARHAERDDAARQADERVRELVRDLAEMSERARAGEGHLAELREAREARSAAENRLGRLESETAARERAFEERLAEKERQLERELARLAAAEDKMQAKFNEIGEKLLTGAQSKFLEGAQTRLETLNKESLAALEKKVGPVGETMERYRKRVEELEKNRVNDFQQLHGVISEVRAGQERVVEGANRITTTLRGATKARGDWGELQLANLLESCGLYDRADFDFQVNVKDESGANLRPDAVINIPGGKCMVVDVKNVFNTYARANEAESEEERGELLRTHARELRGHIDDLAGKRYQDHVPGSADFVVLFVPGEHVLYAALTQDHALLGYALKKNIVLASPLNFMSIALTVSTVWRQAGMQADAEEIARLGKEMYDRLGVVAGHLSQLRKSLASTNQHFDRLVGSFDSNLRRTGERFEELSVDTSAKELLEATPLNSAPRRLTNFPDSDGQDGAERVAEPVSGLPVESGGGEEDR